MILPSRSAILSTPRQTITRLPYLFEDSHSITTTSSRLVQSTSFHVRCGAMVFVRSLSSPISLPIDHAICEGIMQLPVGVPQGEKRIAVPRRPSRGEVVDECLFLEVGHRRSPLT